MRAPAAREALQAAPPAAEAQAALPAEAVGLQAAVAVRREVAAPEQEARVNAAAARAIAVAGWASSRGARK